MSNRLQKKQSFRPIHNSSIYSLPAIFDNDGVKTNSEDQQDGSCECNCQYDSAIAAGFMTFLRFAVMTLESFLSIALLIRAAHLRVPGESMRPFKTIWQACT